MSEIVKTFILCLYRLGYPKDIRNIIINKIFDRSNLVKVITRPNAKCMRIAYQAYGYDHGIVYESQLSPISGYWYRAWCIEYNKGVNDGCCIRYNDQCVVSSECWYKNGKLHGTSRTWDTWSGKVKKIEEWCNGVKVE